MLTHQNKNGGECFQVWIEDESKTPLQEYRKDFLVKKATVTAYIKSTMDQRFRVCVVVDDTEQALCCDLTIDGQCVSSYFLGKWNSQRVDKGITFEDIDGGPDEIIPLRFGQTVVDGIVSIIIKRG